MEDAHTVHMNVTGDRSSAYFGVFDGHGSSQFALYCSENLHQLIINSKHFGECDNRECYYAGISTKSCIGGGRSIVRLV